MRLDFRNIFLRRLSPYGFAVRSKVKIGYTDDGFLDFRSWLISRGRHIYAAALRNPDTLADVVDPQLDGYEFEELQYLARAVYEEATDEEMPSNAYVWPADEPKGERWDFDDEEEFSRRLPKLAALYD